jgi:hypothetical protein
MDLQADIVLYAPRGVGGARLKKSPTFEALWSWLGLLIHVTFTFGSPASPPNFGLVNDQSLCSER